MIRRSRWARPFAALFALWFAVILGDPGMLHSCPMHGGHGGHAAATAAGGHDMAAHASHGMHAAAAMAADAAPQQSAPHHGGTGPCTCVGQCCAASIAAPLPTVATIHLPATVARTEPAQLAARAELPAAPDFRLPFANGPPDTTA